MQPWKDNTPKKKNSHHIIFLSEQLKKNQEPWIDKSGIVTVNRFIQIFIEDYQIFWSTLDKCRWD